MTAAKPRVRSSAGGVPFELTTATIDARVHRGRCILILGDQVVAASPDSEEVARARKEKHPRSVLMFVEEEEPLVYGAPRELG